MNEEVRIPYGIPFQYVIMDDVRYFEERLKRNPSSKIAQAQLAVIKLHFAVTKSIVRECRDVVAKKCPTAYTALAEHFGVNDV